LFLSDSNNLQKWALPDMNISPSETVIINTRNENDNEGIQTNFRPGLGDRLRLSDGDSNVLSLAEVTLLGENEVQRLMNDGRFIIEEQRRRR
jgi:hypothetical protein